MTVSINPGPVFYLLRQRDEGQNDRWLGLGDVTVRSAAEFGEGDAVCFGVARGLAEGFAVNGDAVAALEGGVVDRVHRGGDVDSRETAAVCKGPRADTADVPGDLHLLRADPLKGAVLNGDERRREYEVLLPEKARRGIHAHVHCDDAGTVLNDNFNALLGPGRNAQTQEKREDQKK